MSDLTLEQEEYVRRLASIREIGVPVAQAVAALQEMILRMPDVEAMARAAGPKLPGDRGYYWYRLTRG